MNEGLGELKCRRRFVLSVLSVLFSQRLAGHSRTVYNIYAAALQAAVGESGVIRSPTGTAFLIFCLHEGL